jgi:hypothetical protein
MTRAFLPDYSVMPLNGRYRPLFKLYQDERWRMVLVDRKPIDCGSASEAIQRAKDHVASILNPKIHCERSADVLGIDDWRKRKAEAVEEERASVFAGFDGSRIFRQGREITVERRRTAR